MSLENPEISKTETEVWKAYAIDFGLALQYIWGRGQDYAENDVVRPTRPNGFEYICTVAGQTSKREPVWKKVLGETVIDGSITWTAQAPSVDGRDSIASTNLESPDGITADNNLFSGTVVTIDVSGGTYVDGADPYEISVEMTADTGDVYERKVFVEITGP